MAELDKVHDGVILDGYGYQSDSPEMRGLFGRFVRRGSTDRSRVVKFNTGDYYVASKRMENGATDISSGDVRYRDGKKKPSWFAELFQNFGKHSQNKGGFIK